MQSGGARAEAAHDLESLTDALLVASRALLGVTARSLEAIGDEVTIPQFRALVILTHGARPMREMADELNVHASTATRMCDRLEGKELIERAAGANRREVEVSLTAAGRSLVQKVTRTRRREIARIVKAMNPEHVVAVIDGLREFASAAGEIAPAPEEWRS